MERKVIQGIEYIFDKIIVQSIEILIVGVVSEYDPNLVQFESKRPNRYTPLNRPITYSVPICDFFKDFNFIYKFIDKNGLSIQIIKDALIAMCNNHILEIGRLIDTDLYSYVDEIIIAKRNLFLKFYNQEMKQDEATEMWIELREHVFNECCNFIYISKYDFSNPNDPLVKLVKYIDS